ncbi:MAG: serine/threonine-protein kinase RIO2 [Thermofilaceae archaeon]
MVKEVLEALRQLDQRDLRVLNAVERGMAKFQYVPLEEISRFTGLDLDETLIVTKKLNALGLLRRWIGSYTGYVLTTRGYDCLALDALAKRGTLKSISASPIGRGKEADVYQGITTAGRPVAVKFHRVGRTSFRGTRRYRTYVGDRHHISWLYQSRLAAKNEFEALKILYEAGVSVPEPIDWNRHIVVCEYIEGVELSEVPPLPDPKKFLEELLSQIEKAYSAGIIHADLSEYNIIVSHRGPVIFDWPQWVSRNHPSAHYYLRRDLENLLKFFKRKYDISYNLEEFLQKLN